MKTEVEVLKLITNNGYKFITNGENHQFFPEGIYINKLRIPRNIPNNKRGKFLFALGLNVLGLNPNWSQKQIAYYIDNINNTKGIIHHPLSQVTIDKITQKIFKYRDENGIILKNNTKIYTVFSIDSDFTGKERVSISNKNQGEKRTAETLQMIYNEIKSWNNDKKITQKELSIRLTEKYGKGFSIRTIKEYWNKYELKTFVKGLNSQLEDVSVIEKDNTPEVKEIILKSKEMTQLHIRMIKFVRSKNDDLPQQDIKMFEERILKNEFENMSELSDAVYLIIDNNN